MSSSRRSHYEQLSVMIISYLQNHVVLCVGYEWVVIGEVNKKSQCNENKLFMEDK